MLLQDERADWEEGNWGEEVAVTCTSSYVPHKSSVEERVGEAEQVL